MKTIAIAILLGVAGCGEVTDDTSGELTEPPDCACCEETDGALYHFRCAKVVCEQHTAYVRSTDPDTGTETVRCIWPCVDGPDGVFQTVMTFTREPGECFWPTAADRSPAGACL